MITPYYPYRECMPVFRYDTRDLVRQLAQATLRCSMAAMPACTPILGKAGQLTVVAGRTVTPRELVEAIEDLPGEPWPARFAAQAKAGRLLVRLDRDAAGGLSREEVERHLSARIGGVAVDCELVEGDAALLLRRLRADLLESTFTRQAA